MQTCAVCWNVSKILITPPYITGEFRKMCKSCLDEWETKYYGEKWEPRPVLDMED